jgi:hypothetical protein
MGIEIIEENAKSPLCGIVFFTGCIINIYGGNKMSQIKYIMPKKVAKCECGYRPFVSLRGGKNFWTICPRCLPDKYEMAYKQLKVARP